MKYPTVIFLTIFCQISPLIANSQEDNKTETKTHIPTPCTCGVFLSGQLTKGSKEPPKGVPVLTQETEEHFANNPIGNRQCMNKCLEVVSFIHVLLFLICLIVGIFNSLLLRQNFSKQNLVVKGHLY